LATETQSTIHRSESKDIKESDEMYILYDNHRIKIGRAIPIAGKTYIYDEFGNLIIVLEQNEEMDGVFCG
jgi:hypothetical protein